MMRVKVLALLAVVGVLGGCENMTPGQKGAVTGAALGTGIGMVAGGSFGTALLALAGIAVAASGWLFKLALITRIAYTQGFALQHVPARTPGYSHPGVKPGWN